MLIKVITLFRLRAVSDFVFVFCSLMKLQSVTETKYWHTIFSQLFSFTLRYKLCLCEYSPSRPFLHALCVFDRLDAPEAQSVLCLSVLERAAHAHTHTHTHTRANTHALQPEEQRLSCGLYFQHFIIKHVQQFSNCKDGILQQSTDDWSDSDVKFWSGRNECAPLWREGSCSRRNTAINCRS